MNVFVRNSFGLLRKKVLFSLILSDVEENVALSLSLSLGTFSFLNTKGLEKILRSQRYLFSSPNQVNSLDFVLIKSLYVFIKNMVSLYHQRPNRMHNDIGFSTLGLAREKW